MSIQLLNYLNAGNNGIFKNWIDSLDKNPNIAWYPSCGEDFRSVVYLSPEYNNFNPPAKEINIYPDIFLYTDYNHPYSRSFCSSKRQIDGVLYSDKKTKVRILKDEFLQKLELPLNAEIVRFPDRNQYTGCIFFMEVLLQSKTFGEFKKPLIYAISENEAFCSKVLLPNNAEIQQIIHIRYGHGFGGSITSGAWIQRVFKKINTQMYINDSKFHENDADKKALNFYPNLNGEIPEYEVLRTIDGEKWSNHGDIRWNLIKY